jgi:hypothetical protein
MPMMLAGRFSVHGCVVRCGAAAYDHRVYHSRMLMDELPMIMLTVPISCPSLQANGIDFIWFGIYIILVMELGAIAPPSA